jgi:hypothetical protein
MTEGDAFYFEESKHQEEMFSDHPDLLQVWTSRTVRP